MNFESFDEEELEVPTVEEMDKIEKQRAESPEMFEEKLPESVISELVGGAYSKALEGNPDLPDSAKEQIEGQGEMITNEARELENPGIMSKLGSRAKKAVVIGVAALSFCGGFTALEKKEAEAFDGSRFIYDVARDIFRDDINQKIRECQENERNATTPQEKTRWRRQAMIYRHLGTEGQRDMSERRNEQVRKENQKKQDKARYESQRRAEQQRDKSQRQATQRAAESRAAAAQRAAAAKAARGK